MRIHIIRDVLTEKSTGGLLLVNNVFRCYTLEDAVRLSGVKIPGRTAIPDGRYNVIVNQSARFKREMPLLLNVPNFRGVRIHSGNTAADTDGCILVGNKRETDTVLQSRAMFDVLMIEMKEAIDRGETIVLMIYTLEAR